MANQDQSKRNAISKNGAYCDVVQVALYLHTYGTLPPNYIDKATARGLGWEKESLEPYAPGMCIGGDQYNNRDGMLPTDLWHECDIDTLGASARGQKRIVYNSACTKIYYTEDHYHSFVQILNTAPESPDCISGC